MPTDMRELAPESRLAADHRHALPAGPRHLGIEPDTVWLIVSENVPTLLGQLHALLAALAPGS